jgi:hypothetical protein
LLLVAVLALVAPVHAQGAPQVAPIAYDQSVSETITNEAFYDWWQLDVQQGDDIVVDMQGADGLAPLIGILAPGGDLKAHSDDGQPGGKVELEYTADADGKYTIVATRVGNANGTTTGSYTLLVRRANPGATAGNDRVEVEFRCKDVLGITAAMISFTENAPEGTLYRLSIYGLDGFQPVVRFYIESQNYTECPTQGKSTQGDQLMLPGETPITISADQTVNTVQHVIRSNAQIGQVQLTIGTKDGTSGRYVAVIEGFSVTRSQGVDTIQARLGPLARSSTMFVYMIKSPGVRLDPYVSLENADLSKVITCDDAGRRGCEDVPSMVGDGVRFASDSTFLIGDRFDAGLKLAPGNTDPLYIDMGSRQGDTEGSYGVLIMGEMPPQPK